MGLTSQVKIKILLSSSPSVRLSVGRTCSQISYLTCFVLFDARTATNRMNLDDLQAALLSSIRQGAGTLQSTAAQARSGIFGSTNSSSRGGAPGVGSIGTNTHESTLPVNTGLVPLSDPGIHPRRTLRDLQRIRGGRIISEAERQAVFGLENHSNIRLDLSENTNINNDFHGILHRF